MLAEIAVCRWQINLVAFLLFALLGINAFLSIPRSVDPHFATESIIVTAVLPRADATEMEETVAKPIEDILQGLNNVRDIRATSSDGVAVISVNFIYGTDPDQALDRSIRQ
jgi:multidrug efflux pump subunit AcrB